MDERTIPIECWSLHVRWWGPADRCGHFPWFEAPDRFRTILDSFLAA